MTTNTRSDWQLAELQPAKILDRLIYELGKPIDGNAAFDQHVARQREMGCSSIDGEFRRAGWIEGERQSRERERAELIQWRNEERGKRAAELMAELGGDFHHFSIRSIDSRGGGPYTVEVYRKDSTSPTGVRHAGGFRSCPEVRAAVGASDNEYVGARSGEMSGYR